MTSTPAPDQYLEQNLRDFLRNLGDKVWDIAEDYIDIDDSGELLIDEEAIIKKIVKEDLVKKSKLKKTFALFFGLYAVSLKKTFDKNQDILIERRLVKTLGRMPIELAQMKPDKSGSSPYVKKWAGKMEKASLDFQIEIPRQVAGLSTSKIKDEKLNKLLGQVFNGKKSKKQLAAYLKKKVLLDPKIAERWAQDLTGTYYAESTKQLYRECGIDKYVWIDVGDDKVRAKHRSLNNTIRVPSSGIFPGEEHGCRCIATPYFGKSKKKQ